MNGSIAFGDIIPLLLITLQQIGNQSFFAPLTNALNESETLNKAKIKTKDVIEDVKRDI
jgi:hypothetical protein